MRSNRFERKQEARTGGSIQHEQPTLAFRLLLVTCNAIRHPNMRHGWELLQHIEETRCGMFEPKLAAEGKVSFEPAGLDTSKACHISAGGNARSRAAGSGSAVPGAGKETPANAL